MEIIIQDTQKAASTVAARIIKRVLHEKPNAVIGLAAGGTPLLLYRHQVTGFCVPHGINPPPPCRDGLAFRARGDGGRNRPKTGFLGYSVPSPGSSLLIAPAQGISSTHAQEAPCLRLLGGPRGHRAGRGQPETHQAGHNWERSQRSVRPVVNAGRFVHGFVVSRLRS
jgi:hypothetical protein